MNSNRSSNQSQGKANGKNRPSKKNGTKRKAQGQPGNQPPRKQRKQESVAAAYATGQSGKGAKVQQSRDSIRVVHREFIANVVGTVAFAIGNTFAVQPGDDASFPWLSGIARNWESYRFRKLRYCYYTRTGSNVPGSVIIAHDPDSSDAAPASEQIMTTYESVEEDAPWKDIHMECRVTSLNDLGPRKFIRTGALAANQDIKLYDSGNLFVGTVDGTAVAWGKLWVEYDVELFTPQLPPAGLEAVGAISGSTSMTAAVPFGTASAATGSMNLSASGKTITMTGLTVGQEISVVTAHQGTVFSAIAQNNLVGLTLKAGPFAGFPAAATTASSFSTYIITATTASVDIAITATTVTGTQAVVSVLAPAPVF